MDYRLTPDDKERVRLLQIVSKGGMKSLTAAQLRRLDVLVRQKDYTHSRKAEKSKKKLLRSINIAIYEAEK